MGQERSNRLRTQAGGYGRSSHTPISPTTSWFFAAATIGGRSSSGTSAARRGVRETFQRLYPIRLDTMHARPKQDDELLLYVETRRFMKVIEPARRKAPHAKLSITKSCPATRSRPPSFSNERRTMRGRRASRRAGSMRNARSACTLRSSPWRSSVWEDGRNWDTPALQTRIDRVVDQTSPWCTDVADVIACTAFQALRRRWPSSPWPAKALDRWAPGRGFWTPATPRHSAWSASRRPKSVEARSRGKLGSGGAASAMLGARLGNSKSGGLETRAQLKRFGTIVAK